MNVQDVENMARRMRRKILDVSHSCNVSAHIGGGLSMVDIMATLYGAVLRYDIERPAWEDRDRFILSKGHGALGFYSALAEAGMISEEVFSTFQTNESDLTGHPVMNLPLGIESSNGSLGHGLSMGVGLALAAKKKNQKHKIYVLLGNGECNEGSVWEAIMSGANFGLDNLIAIVDNNGFQNEGESDAILACGDLGDRWGSFGWNVCAVDGHDISELHRAFLGCNIKNEPKVVMARTIKGKGIPFMENDNAWHHNRLTKAHYDRAVQELDGV